jgi:hypothetical protein
LVRGFHRPGHSMRVLMALWYELVPFGFAHLDVSRRLQEAVERRSFLDTHTKSILAWEVVEFLHIWVCVMAMGSGSPCEYIDEFRAWWASSMFAL